MARVHHAGFAIGFLLLFIASAVPTLARGTTRFSWPERNSRNEKRLLPKQPALRGQQKLSHRFGAIGAAQRELDKR
jgi:hypothetical protein